MHVQLVPNNRTRPSFNEFVRRLARDENVMLIDLERYADGVAGSAISQPKWWIDYCHMSRFGYYTMAQEVLRVLLEQQAIHGAPGEPRPAPSREQLIKSDRQLSDLW